MKLLTKVSQRLQDLRRMARTLKEDGLINTTDLLVATGATVTLAASVGSAAIGTLNEAKYGKATPDAQSISMAISQFYKDTGKWPGQAEHAKNLGKPQYLVTSTDASVVPSFNAGTIFNVSAAANCSGNSLEGFADKTIAAGSFSAATKLNINDFLLRKPPVDADGKEQYPNWKGPYLQTEMTTDPWDRTWVFNLQPLYCAEDVAAEGVGDAGALGYAWALSGGGNRTVQTALSDARLNDDADDTGINMGKHVKRGKGGADAGE